jgi:predicted SnoaL-like aldol condensation-catalyzing enzyme
VIVSTLDGDLATIVLVRSHEKDPHDSTKSILKLGVEVIRLNHGKQVEHWDEEMNPGDVPPQLSRSRTQSSRLRRAG